MTLQASPSRPPCDPNKDTFTTLSTGMLWGFFPPPPPAQPPDYLPQGQRWGARETAAKTGDRTHHSQEGALLEAGVEGDELGLRAMLASQETTEGESKSRSYGTTSGHWQNAVLAA